MGGIWNAIVGTIKEIPGVVKDDAEAVGKVAKKGYEAFTDFTDSAVTTTGEYVYDVFGLIPGVESKKLKANYNKYSGSNYEMNEESDSIIEDFSNNATIVSEAVIEKVGGQEAVDSWDEYMDSVGDVYKEFADAYEEEGMYGALLQYCDNCYKTTDAVTEYIDEKTGLHTNKWINDQQNKLAGKMDGKNPGFLKAIWNKFKSTTAGAVVISAAREGVDFFADKIRNAHQSYRERGITFSELVEQTKQEGEQVWQDYKNFDGSAYDYEPGDE